MTESLPADIPTVQEIANSKHILYEHNSFPAKVVRVRDYAIKIGAGPVGGEPENLQFLAQYPGLKVPRFYTAFEDSLIWPFQNCTRDRFSGPSFTVVHYMIVKFIPGDTVEHRWLSLSPGQRIVVQQKLREQLQILRSIKLPEPYFGSFGNRPYHRCEITGNPIAQVFGPYTNEEGLISDITSSIDLDRLGPADGPEEEKRREIEYAVKIMRKSSLFRGSSPTLAVSDFQPKNVMITVIGKAEDGVDVVGDEDIVVTLIDWETMSWWPEWFQYCRDVCFGSTDWWSELLMETLEPWHAQHALWYMVDRALD